MLSSVISALTLASVSGFAQAPWETWKNLERLAFIEPAAQTLLRSSYCPWGCRNDRSSAGDHRFVRWEGDEAVILDITGPGAITRIWATSRLNQQEPIEIPPGIIAKIYLDDSESPSLQTPFAALFDGSTPPFTPPLVGDAPSSSGGYFSYVPIPFARSAKITLVNAGSEKFWYQINYTLLPADQAIQSFDLKADLTGLSTLLSEPTNSPWDSLTRSSGPVTLAGTTSLYSSEKSGWVKELKLCDIPTTRWSDLRLVISADGVESGLPLGDYFASSSHATTPTRSAMVGLDADDCLYSWLPMPYTDSISIAIENTGEDIPSIVHLGTSDNLPPPSAGRLKAVRSSLCPTDPSQDHRFIDLAGQGKWIGQVSHLSSWQTNMQLYLEGDDRIHVDQSIDSRLYGTGAEDIFNAGFYFFNGAFSLPTHGAPYLANPSPDLDTAMAYRFMLTDFVSYRSHLQARIESGPTGDVPMCHASTSFLYVKPAPALTWVDQFQTGDGSHQQSAATCSQLTALMSDEPPTQLSELSCDVDRLLTFRWTPPRADGLFMLRRFVDINTITVPLQVIVNGEVVGHFPTLAANPHRRWASQDILFEVDAPGGPSLDVVIQPMNGSEFRAGRWELHARFGDAIFSSGFQSE